MLADATASQAFSILRSNKIHSIDAHFRYDLGLTDMVR